VKEVTASIRDLIINLHRRNAPQAGLLADEVTNQLRAMRPAAGDTRIDLTIDAIGEVRLLMAEKDYSGAASAAREAAREWRTLAEEPVQG
jgi:hypothetical protein